MPAFQDLHTPAGAPTGPAEALPPSFAQERIWFLSRLQPGSAFYNVPFARRLDGPLDVPALERALGGVVDRHEALRTTFGEVEGAPVQVIAGPGGFTLPVEDLSPLDEAGREQRVWRRAAEEAARPFDLQAGPLFRALLLRLSDRAHVLLLTLHHAVCDGWSLGVLWRETAELYAAFRAGRAPELEELPIQYADFAIWQRERLDGPALGAELAWWRERLAGAPALLELPADRPRPPAQSFRGGHERMELPPGLAERLHALARREGATLNQVLLAAFQVLLARWAGRDDVVLGTPVAGRGRPELQGLIGLFASTLVLRTDLGGDPPFREALRRTGETLLAAYEHQELPFERLVAELHPERSLSHAPVFQVTFVDEGAEAAEAVLPGIQALPLEAERGSAKFDLTLGVLARAGGIRCSLGYAADLFDPATAARMLGHLRRVLEQVADDPGLPLSALDLLDRAERARVLEAWNPAPTPYADACIHALVAEQAARTPDAVAAIAGTESLTYAELDHRAGRLARALRARGVGPESRVGIFVERGLEMVAGVLGILRAGGAYVPLDPAYPTEHLAWVMEDASVQLLVTQTRLRHRLPGDGAPVLCMDAGLAADDDLPGAAGHLADAGLPGGEDGGARPENLAYLIYTSGSTGRPKGVAIEHRQAVALLHWGIGTFPAPSLRGMLASTSLCFDMSVFELFLPLATGGCVIVAENALELPRLPARDRVTVLSTVPSAAAELVRAGGIPAGVRDVCLGGETLPRELADAVLALPGVERLLNLYGPSEDTTYSTWSLVARGGGRAPSLGRPVANTRAYVVHAGLRPLPAGVPGELCLGGAGVARGYLGRPGLTAERFVPDPFSPAPGARMYRTGDRIRWRADGELEFLGRADHQLKVRGFRIEPGEVESALLRAPGVREAVVVARDGGDGPRLVAYVGGAADADALRAHLRRQLPEHMVPSAFVGMERLPRTPNGKVDRERLPAPGASDGGARPAEPRTPVEAVLAEIWAQVLGVPRVGVHDGFFELGGHSLLGARVAFRVLEAFGVHLPLRALFEAPTVAGLAERVEALRGADRPRLPAIVPVDRGGPLPLSFAQERLWFLDRLHPGGSLYNVPAVRRIRGPLDVPALERALGGLTRRHEALRTTFAEQGGAPVQVVAPVAGFALPVDDVRGAGTEAREQAALARAADEARRPFDLAAGPLFRARLLRLAPDDHVLVVCMHHAVSDGWSLDVLFRDLAAFYDAYAGGREPRLPELPVQYADYAAWQREQVRGQALERQLAWWRERLAGAPALLELPADLPRPAVPTYRGAQASLELPAGVLERVRALGRAEGATPYMVLLAAFAVLLSRYGAGDDVVVGGTVAGRTRPETGELAGLFANTLALRTDLSGDPAFREALRRVRATVLDACEHQDLPFEKLVAELQPERSLAHAPLLQVMFSFRDAGDGGPGLAGVDAQPVELEAETAKFDLHLACTVAPRGLRAVLAFATDLFEPGTAGRMLAHLGRLLEGAAADADTRVSRLELLGPAEHARIVEEWNRTERDYPRGQTLHALFARQAARTPDAAALVFNGERTTYAALDARAGRLAARLRALGVGPEVRVAVCMERTPELVAALLAVLRAGGAYVPVDPGYPAERIGGMLEDARAAVVLTQERVIDRIPPCAATVLPVDAEEHGEASPSTGTGVEAAAENTAYVIYTSGSTGRPKGVQIEHRSAVTLLHWLHERVPEDEWGAVLGSTSISFDISVAEIFGTLCRGGTLHLVENALSLAELPPETGITRASMTPSAAAELLRMGRIPPSLRSAGLAGEALPVSVARDLYAAGVGRVENLYGPTEDTTYSTGWVVPRGTDRMRIGRPVANSRAYVLDGCMAPVPQGARGELYLAGDGLARGYLDRPALTAERFLPCPFGPAGSRMYRVGDQVRWTADGELEYLGRLDDQVKVRGFRVEPGEVEEALRAHPAVADAVVVARALPEGGASLAAYVTPARGAAGEPPEAAAFPPEARLRWPNGMTVVPQSRAEAEHFYHDIFEKRIYLRHGVTLEPGDTVFDVGGNIGTFALFASREAPGGRIYTFEPAPAVCQRLRANLALNGAAARAFEHGIAGSERTARFTFYPNSPGMSSFYADAAEERQVLRLMMRRERDEGLAGMDALMEYTDELLDERFRAVEMECRLRPLSAVIREEGIDRIDFLKIDVQKAEREVLDGLAEDDWPRIRQIVIEVHDIDGRLDEVTRLLERRGFSVAVEQDEAVEGSVLYNLFAINRNVPPRSADPLRARASTARVLDDARLSASLRAHLAARLPAFMVPGPVVVVDALPRTPSGKIDRRALPDPAAASPGEHSAAPRGETERAVAEIWKELLGVPRVGAEDGFFDLGGHSLLLVRLHARLMERFGRAPGLVELFRHTTVAALAAWLDGGAPRPAAPAESATSAATARDGRIAIVGMAGRFPGAADPAALWRAVRGGTDAISRFSTDEMRAAGVRDELLADPGYVGARGALDGIDRFDAAFWGMSPAEAEVVDPQHRVFLECAWEAMEDAGRDPGRGAGRVGVFAGSGLNTYLFGNVLPSLATTDSIRRYQSLFGNDKDFLSTRTAYKLGLSGPAVTVQTACSTSLVAIHLACRSLRDGECDMALAGGVSAAVSQTAGYLYQEQSFLSPDGRCRAFDAAAQGTVPGSGCGVVALKRLDDALADGDTIHAVILGSAINNDGDAKVGFTAPGVEGQAAVIRAAHAAAGVDPHTIGYVEAHGTGTSLGDPVEVAALADAFGPLPAGTCALGSLKPNVGHLDTAAGVAGLIKAALALRNAEIPPTPHFTTPNPRIGFERTPFFVAADALPWTRNGTPRRAGVSSFGIGGTNAHVVLEEAPAPPPSDPAKPWQLLLLSARSPEALDAATERLADHLAAHPRVPLADVAFTLHEGRRAFAHRRAVVVREGEDAPAVLRGAAPDRVASGRADDAEPSAVFLFPGVGEQYPGMGRGLYESEPVFREAVDRCAEILHPLLGFDLREPLFAADDEPAEAAGGLDLRRMLGRAPVSDAAARLRRTEVAQPVAFVTGYALARLWESWGIRAAAVLGHSLGEYTAACVAGVFSLEDALELVAARARAIQALPGGAMLAVPLAPDALAPYLAEDVALAAVNAPELCVLAGSEEAIKTVEQRLADAGHAARRLAATHAFHSPLMHPVAEQVRTLAARMRLSAPRIPMISNVTGTWLSVAQATDPGYWAEHLLGTVHFARGAATLLEDSAHVWVDAGPGGSLGTFVRQQARADGLAAPLAVTSLPHAAEGVAEPALLLGALGRLWTAGVRPDWDAFRGGERRRRVPLPTYPFQREPHWIDAPDRIRIPIASAQPADEAAPGLRVPAWRRAPAAPAATDAAARRWLVLADAEGVADALADRLRALGGTVDLLRPDEAGALAERWIALEAEGRAPDAVIHLGCLPRADHDDVEEWIRRGHGALAALAAVAGAARVHVVGSQLFAAESADRPHPAKAALLGASIPRVIDVEPAAAADPERLAGRILDELLAPAAEREVALRGRLRWVREHVPAPRVADEARIPALRFTGAHADALPPHDAARQAREAGGAVVHVVGAADEAAGVLDALAALAAAAEGARCVVIAPAGTAAAAAEAFALRRAAEGEPWSAVRVEGGAEPLTAVDDGTLASVLAAPGEPSWTLHADPPAASDHASAEVADTSEDDVEDEVVALLAEIWHELLGVAPRPGDDFFLLGGHSLLATRLITRVRDLFGVEMRLRTLFQTRTVEAMARWIEEAVIARIDAMSEDEAASLV